MTSIKLKAEIADVSKESLKVPERYLRQKDQDIMELTAECLCLVLTQVWKLP
jgi:hypothetical protein